MAEILKVGYAVYPSVKMKTLTTDAKTQAKKLSFLKELLFGDFITPCLTKDGDYKRLTIESGSDKGDYIQVRCRNVTGYIKEKEMQAQRILEVNFVDVGQGDSCHIVTPDDKHFLIDSGGSDNLYRFLKWRFNLATAKTPPPPFTVVISHSDSDHYKGFGKIFKKSEGTAQQFTIKKIYHNGIIEAAGSGLTSLGNVATKDDVRYITGLCDDDEAFKNRIGEVKAGNYINLLKKTDAPKQALCLGSEPIYDKDGLRMEVLAPVREEVDGESALRVFSDMGKTKNGHSVVIKLTMGNVRMMLGGDLNTVSEYNLIRHYGGVEIEPLLKELDKKSTGEERRQEIEKQVEDAILKARETWEVDIAKSCHHGSDDFTVDFLRVLNPIATIVSSGDDEPYAHPRPEALGAIGKFSRIDRPLIFSTELARSGKEFVELSANPSTAKQKERVVTYYGMINVRTDGEKVVIAQKLERISGSKNWDIHTMVWNKKKGEFETQG